MTFINLSASAFEPIFPSTLINEMGLQFDIKRLSFFFSKFDHCFFCELDSLPNFIGVMKGTR